MGQSASAESVLCGFDGALATEQMQVIDRALGFYWGDPDWLRARDRLDTSGGIRPGWTPQVEP